MKNYFYKREIVNDSWNINNIDRVDIDGNQIYLAKEVGDALPGNNFKMLCRNADVCFSFETELSSADKAILDACVTAHKANT